MLDRIQIFKAGTHQAIDGKKYTFSDADVAAIAAAYDPALLAAPAVLGHPKMDDPAFAWAKGLTVEDGVLVAEMEKVHPAFAEGVEAGSYRYCSAKFYAPTDPANPRPGQWYLRHVGFLGATPPAVKGLAPAFAEPEPDSLVAFATVDAQLLRDLFRRFRDWLIEDKGLDVADQVLPSWYIDNLEVEPRAAFAETTPAPAGGETLPGGAGDDTITAAAEAAFAERSSGLDAREAEIAAREAAFAEGERTRAREEDAAFVDGLVDAGRMPPVQAVRAKALFARLAGDGSVAFAEPDADARVELKAMLAQLGVAIRFDEIAPGDPAFAERQAPEQYAEAIRGVMAEAEGRGRSISASEAAVILRNRR